VPHHVVVVDLGSTGSRAYVYRFQGEEVVGSRAKKVTPGISALVNRTDELLEYFRPLLHHAKSIVPPEQVGSTPIYLKATAGMRLLNPVQQTLVFDSSYRALSSSNECPFMLKPGHLGTISGSAEGYYGALSVNFLGKRIDRYLQPSSTMELLDPDRHHVYGALDLGGSSTQIVFQPHAWLECSDVVQPPEAECPKNATLGDGVLDGEDLFAHSFLSYGVDRVREKLWSFLAENSPQVLHENPCSFRGRVDEWGGHQFIGTGDADSCETLLHEVLFQTCNAEKDQGSPDNCSLDGVVKTPPVHGVSFVAMSVYFFALDCMRTLIQSELEHWPSPTLRELGEAAGDFCALDWSSVSQANHDWTWEDQLPHRCFEAIYIVTILEYAFGFDPHARDITFALEVGGMEVEWTLGFALAAMNNLQ